MSLAAAFLFLFQAEPNDLKEAVRTMASVWALVETNAADVPDANAALYEGALPALLRKLDPHSVFFNPGQFEQLKEMQKSTAKGFGTIVSVLPGRVIVLQALEGSPGAKAGIAAGDEIVAINNIRLDMLDMDQLVQVLSETRQRARGLHVRRPGNQRLMQFTLTPEELASPSVDRAFLLKPGLAYVRVSSFEAETGKQLREAIESQGGRALKGLVLDLRDNPGGVLPAALDAAALFLPAGSKLFSIRGRARELEEMKVNAKAEPYSFPVAVLINEKTASAAEILAGALQEYDRGTVLGTQSFGKGLVQSVYPLSHGTGMALTTAFYFTPTGRSIQKPLKEGQLGAETHYGNLESTSEFKTAKGRPVKGGGGIEPDIAVGPEPHTRLRAFLDASALLTTFATEFLARIKTVKPDFEVTGPLLDDLQLFLSERNVRPGLAEWSADRDWIRSRLHQEILNQSAGVAKGDEVEAARSPQVRRALMILEESRP